MRDGLIWEKNHLALVIEQSKEDFFILCGHKLSTQFLGFLTPSPFACPSMHLRKKGPCCWFPPLAEAVDNRPRFTFLLGAVYIVRTHGGWVGGSPGGVS